MNYTVSDFYRTFENGLKIAAGIGGMSRTITSAGILDYEMESVLKDKFMHTNFHEGQLVVSTFLYAKDNPFLIADAVKHLAAKGVSGLVIKNVFKLPLHDAVLRYADSKNFPIFLIDSQDIYVEKIIYEVSRHCELMADNRFAQQVLSRILNEDLTESEIVAQVKKMAPSCGEQFFTVYFQFDDLLSNAAYDRFMQRFLGSDLGGPGNILVLKDDGMFFTCSGENITGVYTDSFFRYIAETLLEGERCLRCGISRYHLRLSKYKASLRESLYAAAFSQASDTQTVFMRYGQLGLGQILYPFAEKPEMLRYAEDILGPIEDYDIENNSLLLETLQVYLDHDCDLLAAATALGQHKNTIRYRLDKVQELTGLDYKSFTQLTQLFAALKLRQARQRRADIL